MSTSNTITFTAYKGDDRRVQVVQTQTSLEIDALFRNLRPHLAGPIASLTSTVRDIVMRWAPDRSKGDLRQLLDSRVDKGYILHLYRRSREY